ncbi:family 1 glycosylhydrolase [Sphingomonas sp. LY54]|uniref:family 1 glycosylhydrolase n=1 Tax=Sphingomonas sp. LY54 TaxID=3095343 RepID=UPI002D76AFE2|nr:family 1 glycosylhydrolase [Sphingomonas sp. LY54]WRP30115.1 family 1 glycosylhydrolase [Sphingomonas sp. LY54]
MTDLQTTASRLELWGGVECTIARVGDVFRDQCLETGHSLRKGDIDRIADLGVTTVRYPILWESIAPDAPDDCDWAWTDERLHLLRKRGVRVIGGLLHHGSGPKYTSLLDPDFPAKLAAFAARVAERYPWIETWTPINEPLTTARFSGLYGHWFPHRRSYPAFLKALVNQCLGTKAAMAAIRAVIPGAQLLQTEDLGKTFSTAPLRHQAQHENSRRWLSFDLLCGRVQGRHPWVRLLRDAGIGADALEALATGEAMPDILGINHYLTSERFLDHRLALYPGQPVGGNGRQRYIDAEAVRVKRLHLDTGIGPRLREAWERYGIPIAVTEVHHGCTRDEQLRWFAEVWKTAGALRDEGMDLRAVTLWSLFGNVDWRSLLTREDGVYDVGAFDARSPEPRPTVIAAAAKAYAKGEDFDHPVLDKPGWWRRPERLYPWHGPCKELGGHGRKLLITGATGTLGQAFARIAEHRGLPFCLTSRAELDITDEASIRAAIARFEPWAIVNAAGFVRVADAENEREACLAANAAGPQKLARACTDAGLRLVTFSSDLVFDGKLGRAYTETDPVAPANVYGLSKAEAEQHVLGIAEQALVIRTSAFFGPWDKYNFAWHTLSALARGEQVRASRNVDVSPTYVPDLCHAALDLLIDGETGLWHLANQGKLSWYEFAHGVAERVGYDPALIVPTESDPAITALSSGRGLLLRPVNHAIDEYCEGIRSAFREAAE